MSVRNPITLVETVNGVIQPLTGITARLYVYDAGAPNFRGTFKGTFTEHPSGSGSYYIDIIGAGFKGVVTVDDGGGESNLTSWVGKKFSGDVAPVDEVDTAAIQDGAVTAEKTDFLYE